jgi:predicted restriction endonuclease
METLEEFFDKIETKTIDNKILTNNEYFGYKYIEIYKEDVKLLLNEIYKDIKITKEQNTRIEQKEFKKKLMKKYNKKCIITENDCEEELNACHIIPVQEEGDYSINNGLIMERNIHSTYDKFLWSINPNTMEIEINKKKNIGSIKKYEKIKVNIQINPYIYANLMWHYKKFLENQQ